MIQWMLAIWSLVPLPFLNPACASGSSQFTCYRRMGPRWQSRRMCTHLLLRDLQNCSLLLNNHRQENVESHQKKDTPRRKAKKPQKDGMRGEIKFAIKPQASQRCSEGSNKSKTQRAYLSESRQNENHSHRKLTSLITGINYLRYACDNTLMDHSLV